MERQKVFWILITAIISIVLLIIIINIVFKSDKINEGKFRVSDVILTSTAELSNKSEDSGAWIISVSQRNQLSLLINMAKDAKITKIHISDIYVSGKGNIIFSKLNSENKLALQTEKKDLDIEYKVSEDNQILIELIALNENILKDWKVPEGTNEIIYDGRIFKTAGLALNQIQFKLNFKLNIVENNGKTNTMKVSLLLPNEELVTSGADIRRLPLSDFKFKVN